MGHSLSLCRNLQVSRQHSHSAAWRTFCTSGQQRFRIFFLGSHRPRSTRHSEIPKRQGGRRTINAPTDQLKLLQEKLSVLLQDCLEEINEAKQRKDKVAHGFKRKHSIITNARQHRHRRYVFNIDLQDFFPSINFGRVRGFFVATKASSFQRQWRR